MSTEEATRCNVTVTEIVIENLYNAASRETTQRRYSGLNVVKNCCSDNYNLHSASVENYSEATVTVHQLTSNAQITMKTRTIHASLSLSVYIASLLIVCSFT